VLAYVFGRRQDAVFLQRQALLEPCGIRRFYTDGWGAYERHIDPEQHNIGKETTQKIESKHLNLRTRITRLVRRTMGFSNTTTMHDLVIGLFISRDEFGRLIEHGINSSETPSPLQSRIMAGVCTNGCRLTCRRLSGHHPSHGGVPPRHSNASWSGGAETTVRCRATLAAVLFAKPE